jgi:biotin operon repressor
MWQRMLDTLRCADGAYVSHTKLIDALGCTATSLRTIANTAEKHNRAIIIEGTRGKGYRLRNSGRPAEAPCPNHAPANRPLKPRRECDIRPSGLPTIAPQRLASHNPRLAGDIGSAAIAARLSVEELMVQLVTIGWAAWQEKREFTYSNNGELQ